MVCSRRTRCRALASAPLPSKQDKKSVTMPWLCVAWAGWVVTLLPCHPKHSSWVHLGFAAGRFSRALGQRLRVLVVFWWCLVVSHSQRRRMGPGRAVLSPQDGLVLAISAWTERRLACLGAALRFSGTCTRSARVEDLACSNARLRARVLSSRCVLCEVEESNESDHAALATMRAGRFIE